MDSTGRSLTVLSALSPGKKVLNYWSNSNDLHLKILVPSAKTFAGVDIATVSGDILLSGLVLQKLSVRGVSGQCALKNGSSKQVEVRTVSGDVQSVRFLVGALDVKSVSGDVDLEAKGAQKPSYSIKTVSGDLRLQLGSKASPKVQFQSLSGELTNRLGKSQKSAGSIRFSSLSGDAKIYR